MNLGTVSLYNTSYRPEHYGRDTHIFTQGTYMIDYSINSDNYLLNEYVVIVKETFSKNMKLPIELCDLIFKELSLELYFELCFDKSATAVQVPTKSSFDEKLWVYALLAPTKNIEIIQWLHRNDINGCDSKIWDTAAKNGFLDICMYLNTNRSTGFTSDASSDAAAAGHFKIVKFLNEINCEFDTRAVEYAANNGHIEIVQFLMENRNEGASEWALNFAASTGNFEMVKLLHSYNSKCTSFAMDQAAANGHLQIVEFLHRYRTEGCTVQAMNSAAANGYLNVVKFLNENRTEGSKTRFIHQNIDMAVRAAASNGHLEIVQYLQAKRSTNSKQSSWF